MTELYLGLAILCGVGHLLTVLYLRRSGRHPGLLRRLRVSPWITGLLWVAGGILSLLHYANGATPLGALMILLAVPFAITGMVWLSAVMWLILGATLGGLFEWLRGRTGPD